MLSHIFFLSLVQAVRCLVGIGLGQLLIWRSYDIPAWRAVRIEPGDQGMFMILGVVCLAFALLRGVQAGLNFYLLRSSDRGGRRHRGSLGRFARRLGIALAAIDVIDFTLFPITTACGIYGLLVYRHPDSRDFFEGVFSGEERAPSAS